MTLPELTQHALPISQYVNEEVDKSLIFVHHTASSGSPYGVVDYWLSNAERVSTAFLIARGSTASYKDGETLQLFSSKKWGWHLGLKKSDLVPSGKSSTWMNSHSVGIEICNWGYLVEKNGKFITYAGNAIDEKDIVELDTPYRGYKHWQRYTDAQLESCRTLLRYLCDRYNIPKGYKGDTMFDISPACLKGESGIWTHTSVRKDKWDCFPQLELKQMLSSL